MKPNNQRVWSNEEIANHFDRIAELLEAQRANPYRVSAYRSAAVVLRQLHRPVQTILQQQGIDGLKQLPGVGESLSRSIAQLISNGSLALLNQLQGEVEPEEILATVPGIGPRLAEKIHAQLGIQTLKDLQMAALDGRLDQVPGLGGRRLQAVRETLLSRLDVAPRVRRGTYTKPVAQPPSVAELLDVDMEYRREADRDALPKIVPRLFNPSHEAWLPILHTQRGNINYTALFSNTERAHELNRLHDWVVIYRAEENDGGQWTVVTEYQGRLKGKRVVRGREYECELHYLEQGPLETPPTLTDHQDVLISESR